MFIKKDNEVKIIIFIFIFMVNHSKFVLFYFILFTTSIFRRKKEFTYSINDQAISRLKEAV